MYQKGDKVVLVDRWESCVGLYGELTVRAKYMIDGVPEGIIVEDSEGVMGAGPSRRFTHVKSYYFNQLYKKLNDNN